MITVTVTKLRCASHREYGRGSGTGRQSEPSLLLRQGKAEEINDMGGRKPAPTFSDEDSALLRDHVLDRDGIRLGTWAGLRHDDADQCQGRMECRCRNHGQVR